MVAHFLIDLQTELTFFNASDLYYEGLLLYVLFYASDPWDNFYLRRLKQARHLWICNLLRDQHYVFKDIDLQYNQTQHTPGHNVITAMGAFTEVVRLPPNWKTVELNWQRDGF